MLVRIISAVVAIPLLLIFIILGGLPLRFATCALSLVGMYELYKAVSGKIKTVHIVGFLLELWYSYSLYNHSLNDSFMPAFIVAVLAVLIVLVLDHKNNNINDGAITLFGFLYVGMLLGLICEIRDYALSFAWLPFIFAFVSDTGAYFVGSKLGKHKLTPELSPKKTVEGALGGVLSVAVVTVIYSLICTDTLKYAVILVLCGVVGAVLSQIGDLAASSIKRYVGIKDYGKIMPGHGGVLDRFDSVLFTIPLVYFYATFFIRL